MPCFRLPGVVTLLLAVSLSPALAQSGVPIRPHTIPDEMPQADTSMMHKLEKARQKKRYEEMKRDSQKLLELATELKQYMDKAGENTLSVDVVRKAEEMEKLARRVKENMRGD